MLLKNRLERDFRFRLLLMYESKRLQVIIIHVYVLFDSLFHVVNNPGHVYIAAL